MIFGSCLLGLGGLLLEINMHLSFLQGHLEYSLNWVLKLFNVLGWSW